MTETITTSESREHAVWVGNDNVLSFALDRHSKGFPPAQSQVGELHRLIQELARAAKSVIYQAENDSTDPAFTMQPVEGIADTIILLSQMAAAVQSEVNAKA